MASGKYELVHEYFEKMKKSGNAPKALTYKGTLFLFYRIMTSCMLMKATYKAFFGAIG